MGTDPLPLLLTIMFTGHLLPGRLAEMVAVHGERLAAYRRTRKEHAVHRRWSRNFSSGSRPRIGGERGRAVTERVSAAT